MKWATYVMVLAAVIHIVAGFVEMNFWPWFAKLAAGIATEHGEATRVVGWNQGLYNLFLAGGLLYATFMMSAGPGRTAIQTFCLICFCIAGIGALYSMHSIGAFIGQTVIPGVALYLLRKHGQAEA